MSCPISPRTHHLAQAFGYISGAVSGCCGESPDATEFEFRRCIEMAQADNPEAALDFVVEMCKYILLRIAKYREMKGTT